MTIKASLRFFVFFQIIYPGVDVLILKVFSPQKIGEKMAFLLKLPMHC
jgi:hypothetical protein